MPHERQEKKQHLWKTYGLVNSSTIQGLHGPLCRTGVIVLDKAIVVALGLHPTVSKMYNPTQHHRRIISIHSCLG